MSREDLILVVMTGLSLLAFGLAGRRWPEACLWKWADVFYYPLGAIGVVLLFLASEANRTHMQLLADKAAFEDRWSEHLGKRPQPEFGDSSTELLAARYSRLQVVVDHGKLCETGSTPGCSVRAGLGKLVQESFSGFTPNPKKDERIERVRKEVEFCRRSGALLDRLDAEPGATENVLAVRQGLAQVAQAGEEAAAMAVEQRMAEQRRRFLEVVQPSARHNAATDALIRGDFALQLFSHLAWCASRSPDDIQNLWAVDRWEGQARWMNEQRTDIDRGLAESRTGTKSTSWERSARSVLQERWPFILVFALAIKFGKAMSSIPAGTFRRLIARLLGRPRRREDRDGNVADETPRAVEESSR